MRSRSALLLLILKSFSLQVLCNFLFLFHFILYVLSILSSANKINDDDGLYSVSCDYKNIRARAPRDCGSASNR